MLIMVEIDIKAACITSVSPQCTSAELYPHAVLASIKNRSV